MRAIWDLEDDPRGNVHHIAKHGLDIEDVEYVLAHPTSYGQSRRSGRPCVLGYTQDGRHIMVIYDEVDEETIYVVTAFKPRKRDFTGGT